MALTPAQVIGGIPYSDSYKPKKRDLIALLEQLFEIAGGYDVNYATRAELYADLTPLAGAIGRVFGDSTSAFNGVYKKSGGTGAGSWTKIGDLPVADVSSLAADITTLKEALAPRVFLRPTTQRFASIIVDRAALTVSFPTMVAVRPGLSAITAGSGDARTVLALSANISTFNYYYIDVADSTIKLSTNAQYGVSTDDWIAIGRSSNGSYHSAHGHRIRNVSDEVLNVRITARPNTAEGKSSDAIVVDRAQARVGFPSLSIWRANQASVFVVSPAGWSSTAYTYLPLAFDYSETRYYYVDLNTLTLGSTTDPNSPLQSETLIYIGSSIAGSFTSQHGLRVEYLQVDKPSLGQMSREGVAREAQAGWGQTQYASRRTYLYSGTKLHPVQPVYTDDVMRVSGTGGLDLTYFSPASTLKVRTFSAPVSLYAGAGRTFLGETDNEVTVPANSMAEVISSFGDIIVRPVVGTLTFDTIADPVRDVSILLAGQSQRVFYGNSGGLGGFHRALRDTTWLQAAIDVSINWVFGATGETAIDRRSVAVDAVNYWWDAAANGGLGGPGPALDTCIDAIDAAVTAGQPAPEWVFWALGETDATALQSGALTVAQATSSLIAVWDYIRANGAPDAEFLVSPVGSTDFGAMRGITGSRVAALDAIESQAYAHLGAEYYDLPRMFGNVHLVDIGYAAWGQREARVWANLAYDQTNELGPTVTGATLSANKRVVTIAYSRAGPLYIPEGQMRAGEVNGPYPFGIGIIPAGQPVTATPAVAVRGYVSGTSLVIEADRDLTGCTLVGPYGHFPEHRNGQFIRDFQSDIYHGVPGLPMRSFVLEL